MKIFGGDSNAAPVEKKSGGWLRGLINTLSSDPGDQRSYSVVPVDDSARRLSDMARKNGAEAAPAPAEGNGAPPADTKAPEPEPEPEADYEQPTRKEGGKPIIGILIDGKPSFSMFGKERGPVHIFGGRTALYGEAVEKNGGEVAWIYNNGKKPEEILEGLDGLLIPGGGDLDPNLYGQDSEGSRGGNSSFDRWQFRMVETALENKVPTRGICRGLQLINVVKNGTLIQDIGTHSSRVQGRSYNWQMHHTSSNHPISIMPSSRFGSMVGAHTADVNSSHHQAIGKLGDGLVATALAADGTIEAIELKSDPTCLAVQFHPERLSGHVFKQFFTTFVDDASKYSAKRPQTMVATLNPKQFSSESRSYPSYRSDSRPSYYRSEPTPAPAPKVETKVESTNPPEFDAALDAGAAVLETMGYRMDHCQIFHGNAHYPMVKYPQKQAQEFLLALTPAGREMLEPGVKKALQMVDDTMALAKKSSPEHVFKRKTGMLSKEPVLFRIEAAWHLNKSFKCGDPIILTRQETPWTGDKSTRFDSAYQLEDYLKAAGVYK